METSLCIKCDVGVRWSLLIGVNLRIWAFVVAQFTAPRTLLEGFLTPIYTFRTEINAMNARMAFSGC